jgi:methionyl-tRNA synthetase
MSKKILIGVAWPYVNGDIHLGHLAGYLLPADIFARYHRLRGNDVLMVSGSDCHGTPITVEADKQKVTPAEVVAQYHAKDVALFKQYNLSYNLYTKTTTENHKVVVHEVFMDLLKKGYIVKGIMKQYYSAADKQFLPDRYVEGTCPYCGTKDQRSDQCENCGRWIGDGELIEPHSKLTGSEVELRDTEHYFLDFPKLSKQLRDYVDGKLDDMGDRRQIWRDWVYKETEGWLREGLNKRAITRDMDWSIELPITEIKKLDPEKQLKDFTGKRIYVWFEAVIGYLSAAVEWSKTDKESEDNIFLRSKGQSKDWKDWWLNKDAEIYNFMGQDNLVFHTLMWPGELIGTGRGYALPRNVIVNKFMNYEGKKFSKSRGWTIDSKKMADKYGVDLIRYYISANLPENKEADFTWEGFVDSVNNELVANLGNFINRTLKFLESKMEGKLTIKNFKMDPELEVSIQDTFEATASYIEQADFVAGLNAVMELARKGNQYFDQQKIWQVIKTDKPAAEITMLNLLNLVSALVILMGPFVPETAAKLTKLMGERDIELSVGTDFWKFKSGESFKLNSVVEIAFPKLDKEVVLQEKEG